MAKPKFVLTSDLIKVEPEPIFSQAVTPSSEKSVEKEISHTKTDPVPFSPPIKALENKEGDGEKSSDKKSFPTESPATKQPHPLYDTRSGIPTRELSPPQPSNHTSVSHNPEAYNSPGVLQPPQTYTPADTSFDAPSKTAPVSLRESSLFLRMRESNQPSVVRDQFNLKIDRDLKRDFRLWCLLREISMTEALEDAGFDFVTADDGDVALEGVKEHDDISLIVLDRIMPKMNGMDVIKVLKNDDRYKTIPILFTMGLHVKSAVLFDGRIVTLHQRVQGVFSLLHPASLTLIKHIGHRNIHGF